MKEANVQVRRHRKYKVTTNSNHKLPLFDNLWGASLLYPTLIKYMCLTSLVSGHAKVAVIIDLYSRKVVGWSMDVQMTASLVCDALTMAI